jgi:hypothetical protein
MDNNIKRCVDCDHVYAEWGQCQCKSPKNVKPVNGLVGCKNVSRIYNSCEYLRDDVSWRGIELCGPSGKWFEPRKLKPSWWNRIINFIKSL